MSATEILVILFGLFIGYWVVSKLFTGGPQLQAKPDVNAEPNDQSNSPEKSKDEPRPWHEILSVPQQATIDEIRQAYKLLIHQYHPDKVASLGAELKVLAERKSKEINAAYDQAMKMRGECLKALAILLFAGKMGKFLASGGTMLLSIVTYAFIYGWWYAVGFVLLIFAHEMGHYLAAKKCGLNVGLPTFIPFVGAWIELKEQPMNAETEAFVGIAGPMLGSAAAFLCYIFARDSGSGLLMALAYAGFFLNLFNLIPLAPLDGGRIVSVISPRIWFLGIPLLVGLFLWRPSPLLILIAILAIPQVWTVFKNRGTLGSDYYRAPKSIRLQYAVQYLLLASFLAIMAFEVHETIGAV